MTGWATHRIAGEGIALVPEGRCHRLHRAAGHARRLDRQRRRLQSAASHRRQRRQPGRDVGAQRPPSRLPVQPQRPLADLRDARGRNRAGGDHHRHRRGDKPLVVAAAAVIQFQAFKSGTHQQSSKGGVMVTRGSFLVVTSLLVVAVVGNGCAKRPATTQAAAPAPTGRRSRCAV